MILFINTASSENITLALLDGKGEILVKKKIAAKYKQSEKLLVGIDRLMGGRKNLKKLIGIIAVKGPGSFTALRIGITTANTMAFGLRIPVVGVTDGLLEKLIKEGVSNLKKAKVGNYVMPEYGAEPNITTKKQ
ncbi:tRNA (adenosine(37)-N6)-threonylcarbamoyltransferase complex dimerization subunit type 1 TsaB [Candidatus Kuenenbacteria bacterium]|nr:tRNA (adenosine(37)-N6)-threonylcarbamoyltransferase complex dimerization subunit type 1 TsaB [Candidatus Kuenenbacteria bacterium]